MTTSPTLVRAVSNTSPLINLAVIDCLNLLSLQFDKILIPTGVHTELQLDNDAPGNLLLRQAIDDGWIEIFTVNNIHLVQALQMDLDLGEAEAIALALEFDVSTILLDEADGRQAAKLLNLGVLGILMRAKISGQISELSPLIHKLRNDAGFYISSILTEQILIEAGEG